MAFTASAAVTGAQSLDVTITLGTPPAYTDYTVTAVTASRTYRVRGTITGTTIVDHYAPLNQAVTYQVRVLSSGSWVQADTSPVTVPDNWYSVLTETNTDTSMFIAVQSLTPNMWETQSVSFAVLGRDTPIVAQAPAKLRTGTLRILSLNLVNRDQVRAMLALGYPIVLRSATRDRPEVDDLTFLPLTFQEGPQVPGSPYRAWEITYQAVSVELASYQTYWATYAGLAAYPGVANYAALGSGAKWASYAAVVLG